MILRAIKRFMSHVGPRGAACRHACFSEAIAKRYLARSGNRQAQASMVLAQRWMLHNVVQRLSQHWLATIAPRIHIRVNGKPTAHDADRPTNDKPGRVMPGPVGYVQTRARRVEPVLGSAVLPPGKPVPLVLARRTSAVAREEPAARSSSGQMGFTGPDDATPALRSTTIRTAPPLDVERLTEQVIKGIDRRIIAQRERLGRF